MTKKGFEKHGANGVIFPYAYFIKMARQKTTFITRTKTRSFWGQAFNHNMILNAYWTLTKLKRVGCSWQKQKFQTLDSQSCTFLCPSFFPRNCFDINFIATA